MDHSRLHSSARTFVRRPSVVVLGQQLEAFLDGVETNQEIPLRGYAPDGVYVTLFFCDYNDELRALRELRAPAGSSASPQWYPLSASIPRAVFWGCLRNGIARWPNVSSGPETSSHSTPTARPNHSASVERNSAKNVWPRRCDDSRLSSRELLASILSEIRQFSPHE